MDRRQLLKAGLAWPLAFASGAQAKEPIYIADMHFHIFFPPGPNSDSLKPLARRMADGKATLIAWSLVGDLLWMQPTPRGLKQKSVPKAGETLAWFQRELARIKSLSRRAEPEDRAHAGRRGAGAQGRAARGAVGRRGKLPRRRPEPGPGRLRCWASGTSSSCTTSRTRSAISRPRSRAHNGLSDFGKKVVEECNRLGILIDLAHCSDAAVSQALAISKAPMVWSHSSVTRDAKPHWSMPAWRARQLSLDRRQGHRRQGRRGRPVGAAHRRGLQPRGLRRPSGGDGGLAGRGPRRLRHRHERPGRPRRSATTRTCGAWSSYWERRGMSESRIRKIAMENYARVLRQALAARQA